MIAYYFPSKSLSNFCVFYIQSDQYESYTGLNDKCIAPCSVCEPLTTVCSLSANLFANLHIIVLHAYFVFLFVSPADGKFICTFLISFFCDDWIILLFVIIRSWAVKNIWIRFQWYSPVVCQIFRNFIICANSVATSGSKNPIELDILNHEIASLGNWLHSFVNKFHSLGATDVNVRSLYVSDNVHGVSKVCLLASI